MLAHPLAVAPGQVVVDGDDVHALAREWRSGSRPAWRRASCPRRSSSRRCVPLVQGNAADELHVEVTHAQRCAGTPRRTAAKASGSRSSRVSPFCVALAEDGGLTGELLVAHGVEARLECVYLVGDAPVLLELLVGPKGEDLGEKIRHLIPSGIRGGQPATGCNQLLTLPALQSPVSRHDSCHQKRTRDTCQPSMRRRSSSSASSGSSGSTSTSRASSTSSLRRS